MSVLANELKILRVQALNLNTSLQEMGNQDSKKEGHMQEGQREEQLILPVYIQPFISLSVSKYIYTFICMYVFIYPYMTI